jgi:hypothetical protein
MCSKTSVVTMGVADLVRAREFSEALGVSFIPLDGVALALRRSRSAIGWG